MLYIEIMYFLCYPANSLNSINILRKITYSLQSKLHSQPTGFLTLVGEGRFSRSPVNHRCKVRRNNNAILISLRTLLAFQETLLNHKVRNGRSLKFILRL